jgi:hypothetical protein
MIIEFYEKESGEVVPTGDYFILNGSEVWRDNYNSYESQSTTIGFDDCIIDCPSIGWRVVKEVV